MSTPELHQLGVAELAAKLAARDVSSAEVTRHLLDRAQQHSNLGAYLALDADVALRQAQAADARLAAGERTPLLGVPLAHKDIFVTREFPTTAGSKMLAGYRSPFDATVVTKLADAGMVTLGKLNCDEFAMGSGNDNSAYQPAHNPWDTERIPGGSSGGSAAAVAARLVPAATGTDTGGSIRQPASLDRHHRHQAHLRPLLALRHGGVCLQPGPGGPHGAQRAGLCVASVGHGRA
jgi:aspartyl-tRNA(Asn)/glutamyl-tRNA(Gln) amidotransferase subunit A